jgi:hypothetical protein
MISNEPWESADDLCALPPRKDRSDRQFYSAEALPRPALPLGEFNSLFNISFMSKLTQVISYRPRSAPPSSETSDDRAFSEKYGFDLPTLAILFWTIVSPITRVLSARRQARCIRKTNAIYCRLRRTTGLNRPMPSATTRPSISLQRTEAICRDLRAVRPPGPVSASSQQTPGSMYAGGSHLAPRLIGTVFALLGVALGMWLIPSEGSPLARWYIGGAFALLATTAVWIQPALQRATRVLFPPTIRWVAQLGYVVALLLVAWLLSWVTRSYTHGR